MTSHIFMGGEESKIKNRHKKSDDGLGLKCRLKNMMTLFKVWELEKYTKLNTIFCLIKSSEIVFIFLPAFDLIIWFMTSPKKFF